MAEKPKDIDGYIAALPEGGRGIAEVVRGTIMDAAPGASETLKYGMPAFQIGGKSFIYFAVWKKHIGLYPIYRGDADFEAAVEPYRAKTDTVQFPLNEPMPLELIARIVKAQLAR